MPGKTVTNPRARAVKAKDIEPGDLVDTDQVGTHEPPVYTDLADFEVSEDTPDDSDGVYVCSLCGCAVVDQAAHTAREAILTGTADYTGHQGL